MSAGSKIIPVRIAEPMEIEIREAMQRANKYRREAEYDMSSWIRAAIQEKLDHLHRGRRFYLDPIPCEHETVESVAADEIPDCILPNLSL